MSKNFVRKTFTENDTWVCPAGVTQVRARAWVIYGNISSRATGNFLAVKGNGIPSGFGANSSGQLGDNSAVTKSSPVVVATNPLCIQLTGDGSSVFAITTGGLGIAWGENSAGELGVGDTTDKSTPVAISSTLTWRKLGGGYGITTDGDAYRWGVGSSGAIGNNATDSQSAATLVSGGKKWKTIQYQSIVANVFGIEQGTNLGYAWGANSSGQLGVGDISDKSIPTAITGAYTWKKLIPAIDGAHLALGITTDGDGYAWGDNQLSGDGSSSDTSTPSLISGAHKWKDIIISGTGSTNGDQVAIGLTTAQDAYGWGVSDDGQFGSPGTGRFSTPTLVSGGLKWKSIGTAGGALYGVDTSDDLYVWGYNAGEYTGDGSVNLSTPTLITGGHKWRYANLGSGRAYAITNDGDGYAWGTINTNGCLGVGDTSTKTTPTLILGAQKWSQFVLGFSSGPYAIGFTQTGALYGMGYNAGGELGVGDTTSRSSPTIVAGTQAWQIQKERPAGDITVDVIPGKSYPITIFGDFISFGDRALALGFGENKLDLEYFG